MSKLTALLVALVPAFVLIPAASADTTLTSETTTFDCGTDGTINIDEDGGSFTLTGECSEINLNGSNVHLRIASTSQLNVNGSSNSVTVASLGTVLVNGDKNTVRWRKAQTGRRPSVITRGSGNSVARAR